MFAFAGGDRGGGGGDRGVFGLPRGEALVGAVQTGLLGGNDGGVHLGFGLEGRFVAGGGVLGIGVEGGAERGEVGRGGAGGGERLAKFGVRSVNRIFNS
jgi:hypothetical protein